MRSRNTHQVSVFIDKLTHSIVNTISGDSFLTQVLPLTKPDLKIITKRKGWLFNWASEFRQSDRKLFKLTLLGNPDVIQGVMSLLDMGDHFFLYLVETAPFNRGKHKLYEGVAGNLFAFACKTSWDAGYQGFVSFISKTKLIEHYENVLGATHIGSNKMIIFPKAASKLIQRYYPN